MLQTADLGTPKRCKEEQCSYRQVLVGKRIWFRRSGLRSEAYHLGRYTSVLDNCKYRGGEPSRNIRP